MHILCLYVQMSDVSKINEVYQRDHVYLRTCTFIHRDPYLMLSLKYTTGSQGPWTHNDAERRLAAHLPRLFGYVCWSVSPIPPNHLKNMRICLHVIVCIYQYAYMFTCHSLLSEAYPAVRRHVYWSDFGIRLAISTAWATVSRERFTCTVNKMYEGYMHMVCSRCLYHKRTLIVLIIRNQEVYIIITRSLTSCCKKCLILCNDLLDQLMD